MPAIDSKPAAEVAATGLGSRSRERRRLTARFNKYSAHRANASAPKYNCLADVVAAADARAAERAAFQLSDEPPLELLIPALWWAMAPDDREYAERLVRDWTRANG